MSENKLHKNSIECFSKSFPSLNNLSGENISEDNKVNNKRQIPVSNTGYTEEDVSFEQTVNLVCKTLKLAHHEKRWSLYELFYKQVLKTPNNIAVVFQNIKLTYSEINDCVLSLVNALETAPNEVVGLYFSQHSHIIISILALWNKNCAYLPIDTKSSKKYIEHICIENNISTILTNKQCYWQISNLVNAQKINIVTVDKFLNKNSNFMPFIPAYNLNQCAYVMYTSGSTGSPKGIAISQASVINLLSAMNLEIKFQAGDCFISATTYTFDISIIEWLLPLTVGGTTILFSTEQLIDYQLINTISSDYVNIFIQATPSVWQSVLTNSDWEIKHPLKLLTGGEALTYGLANKLLQKSPDVWNCYGPTETTIWSTIYKVEPLHQHNGTAEIVPIGKPLFNTWAYILDEKLNPMPVGLMGELYLGGVGLLQTYIGKQADSLNKQKLISNPFNKEELIYKTGDHACWLPNGNLQFLGRFDDQVKIRGFRVDLNQITSILETHEFVKKAIALKQDKELYNASLIAYLSLNEQKFLAKHKEIAQDYCQQWVNIYDRLYQKSSDHTIFDTTGWISSYTGRPLPKADMEEWVSNTVDKILSFSPNKVLEIGCGMGLLLFPIAPRCNLYHGTDLSSAALEHISTQLTNKPYKNQVKLSQADVSTLNLTRNQYDTIIINSVVQYFPHIYFLVEILDHCINSVAQGGQIFIGDVRSYKHLKHFHASATFHRSSSNTLLENFKQRYFKSFQQEKELVIDPLFFIDFAKYHTRISHINIELKVGHCENELNDYRYDVVLHIEKQITENAHTTVMNWQQEQLTLPALTNQLGQQHQAMIHLADIPNQHWTTINGLLDYLKQDTKNITLQEYFEFLPNSNTSATSPAELKQLATSLNYEVSCIFPISTKIDCFDAIFYKKSYILPCLEQTVTRHKKAIMNWQMYANKPWHLVCHKIVQDMLHQYLSEKLPYYMIPSLFVIVDEIPLTANGKINKKALAEHQPIVVAKYHAANTAIEQVLIEIWRNILGIEEIGIYDNFFELGGHSLNALRVLQSIEERWHINLDMMHLFSKPIVFELAQEIQRLLALGSANKSVLKHSLSYASQMVCQELKSPFRKIIPTLAQQSLLFLNQYEENNPNYNVSLAVQLNGHLEIRSLRKSFAALIRRHQALRSSFMGSEPDPISLIHQKIAFQIPIEKVHKQDVVQSLTIEANRQFNLSAPPLIRAKLFKTNEDEYILCITMHHIISDARSLEIIIKELSELYTAYVSQKKPRLSKLKLQYFDLINWVRDQNKKESISKQLDYWKNKLQGFQYLNLPTDFPHASRQTYVGDFYQFEFDSHLIDQIREFSIKNNVTLFMAVLAVFNVLLSRYSGKNDIVIGTPMDNRIISQSENVLGFFINTVVLRHQLFPDASFESLLQQVKKNSLEAHANQFVPFELLVNELRIERSFDYNPIFQAMFVWPTNFNSTKWNFPRIYSKEVLIKKYTTKFDLTFEFVINESNNLELRLEYNSDLYRRTTIQKMASHLENLFREIIENPKKEIKKLQLLTSQELEQILVERNSPRKIMRNGKKIHVLFSDQASKTPDNIALVFESKKLTYKELDDTSTRLANVIHKEYENLSNAQEDSFFIGICVERSLDLLIGILAILKTGAAYVPLDPTLPEHRLKFIIEDAGCHLILTKNKIKNKNLMNVVGNTDRKIIDLDALENDVLQVNNSWQSFNSLSDLAYVIYTSGTTGNPKGVIQTHQNVHRLFTVTDSKFHFNEHDVWTLFHSYTFDFSIWEIWGSLLYGGTLVVPTYEQTRDPALFRQLVVDHKVTVLNQTPSAFQLFVTEDLHSNSRISTLRYVIFGGEALHIENLVPWWNKYGDNQPQLINMYGITETTVHATYKLLKEADIQQKISNIGKPLDDLTAYVVDSQLNLLPIGVPGELLIGNAGLAEGYLNLPNLTEQKFIESPFLTQIEKDQKKLADEEIRLYRTGDLVRWLEDGSLEYMGRIDNQVKICGFRIELGEIETVLNKHPNVHQAIAQVIEIDKIKQIIVYYLVKNNLSKDKKGFLQEQLKAHLEMHLPDYMLPKALIEIKSIPLTANMKVDFKALSKLLVDRVIDAYQLPQQAQTQVERLLVEIWQKTLKISNVKITDNFFSIGGDSMSSIRIVYAAREKGLDISVSDIFKYQTIKQLAEKYDFSHKIKTPVFIKPFSLISHEDGKRLPANIEDAYPQAMLQTGMLYHSMNDIDSAVYLDVFSYYVFGEYYDEYFKKAFNILIYENPILRTSFNITDFSEPLQIIHKTVDPKIVVFDINHLSEGQQAQELDNWMEREKLTPFDYTNAPLFRVIIHKLASKKFLLSFAFHHAILDGWSVATLLTRLIKKYAYYIDNTTENIECEVDYNYKIFVAMEKEATLSKQQENFWKKELAGFQFSRIIPWSKGREKNVLMECKIPISRNLSDKLQILAQKINVSLDAILLSAHFKLLSIFTGLDDVTAGVVFNGRPEVKDIEKTLGLFLNSLPLRQSIVDGTWKDLILQTSNKKSEVYPYRHYPFGKIYADMGSKELFDILFYFVNFHVYQELNNEDFNIAIEPKKLYERTNFPLVLVASLDPSTNAISCILKYQAKIYPAIQIEVIAQYYQRILEIMTDAYDLPHSDVDLMLPEWKNKIFKKWNNTRRNYPFDKTLVTLFEEQVNLLPGKIAVIFGNMNLTYQQLNQKANQLAQHLKTLGVGKETCVIIYMERSLDLLIATLATFKAGGVYVPVDLSFTTSRIKTILDDTKSRFILTKSKEMESADFSQSTRKTCICLDAIDDRLSELPTDNLNIEIEPKDLSYIIYTSGSTGQPKGVMIEHNSLTNLMFALQDKFAIKQQDVFLALTAISFDISLVELYLPLISGASCVISDQDMARNPARIIDAIEDNRVTAIQATPTTWRVLFDAGWKNQQNVKILSGGEALSQDLAQKIINYSKNQVAWNLYGPTETTIWSTICPINNNYAQLDYYPIGAPLANTKVFILNRDLRLCPIGVTGELYISGNGLARGYLNRPELTREKFLSGLCSDFKEFNLYKLKLYRTGDLVQWMPDGNIIYKGRVDNQIKVRGYRIEPGEIEYVLLQHKAISQCVVLSNKKSGLEQLVAYLVLQSGNNFDDLKEVTEFLRKKLPHYMIPDKLLVVDKFPLNTSGKIDLNMLTHTKVHDLFLQRRHIPPTSTKQKQLAKIWSEILKIEKVSIDDSFFDLGGNSVTTLKLVNRIIDRFQVKLELADIIELATLEKISAKILELKHKNKKQIAGESTANFIGNIPNPVVKLRGHGQKSPLFLIHPVGGGVFYYLPLVKELPNDRPIYAIQDPGMAASSGELFFHNIQEMAEFYISAIKRYQSTGPYFMAGSSFGANVAVEMARLLIDRGKKVAFVGLLDGFARYPAEIAKNRTAFDNILKSQLPYLHKEMPDVDIPKFLFDLHWHRQLMLDQQTIPDLSDLNLTLFKAVDILAELKSVDSDTNLWGEHNPKSLIIHKIPGNHLTMHFKPNVLKLAELLSSSLIEAEIMLNARRL